MRGIAVVWLAALLSLAWADDLREASLILRGEPLHLNPPPLWDGRELWLPVSHLERLGVPLEVGDASVRIPHMPADQPTAHVPIEPKRGVPCAPVRDLVRRLGGYTRWDDASGTLSVLARLQHAHLEADALRLKSSVPVAWRAFTLENPSRLVIDLAGCALPDVPLPLPEPSGAVKNVRLAQFDPHTVRLVLEMDTPTATPTQGLDSEWRIALSQTPSGDQKSPSEGQTLSSEDQKSPSVPLTPVEIPPLQRDSSGVVRLTLPLPEGARPRVQFLEDPIRIAVDVPGYLAEPMEQAFDDPSLFVRVLRAAPIDGGMVRVVLELARSVGAQILTGKAGVTLNLRAPRNTGGKLRDKIIVIDPGHGGAQPGARWRAGKTVIEEKTITLAIGLQVAELLSREGAKVVLTRAEDKALGLYERTALANGASAHFFISLHCDSNPRANSASGTTIYYHKDDADSRALGQALLNEIVKVSGLPSRGVRSDSMLYQTGLAVLRTSQMPAVLIEVGYLNHATDRAKLTDAKFQRRIAEAIVRGLKAHVEGR